MTISSFGYHYKGRHADRVYVTPQRGYEFPYELPAGKSITQWTELAETAESLFKANKTSKIIRRVYFTASSGRTFTGKFPNYLRSELDTAIEALKQESSDPSENTSLDNRQPAVDYEVRSRRV